MRELLERILSEAGHEVVTVADGLGAMARLEQPFDLVITDLRMPGADGLEVLQVLAPALPHDARGRDDGVWQHRRAPWTRCVWARSTT